MQNLTRARYRLNFPAPGDQRLPHWSTDVTVSRKQVNIIRIERLTAIPTQGHGCEYAQSLVSFACFGFIRGNNSPRGY